MTRPTLVTLADQLGVSRQTVSNALNFPERLKPETRDRVLAAIRESGYRPLESARALRTQRTRTLAMRLYPSSDGINGTVMDRYLHALVEAAEARGHRITLFTASSPEDEARAVAELAERKVIDGCILSDTVADDPRPGMLTEAGVPFGAFGRPWGDLSHAHIWVDVDGAAGTRNAVDHLVGLGCRRIGFLGWPVTSGVGDDRRRGWADGVASHGLAGTEDLLVGVEDSIGHGAEGAAVLLEREVDGIVCVSDSLAVGALQQARWQGKLLEAGEQTPIIGFDDTPVVKALGLSSLEQPVEKVASTLIDLLMRQLTGDGMAQAAQLLPPTLHVRRLAALSGPPPTSR